MDFCWHINDPRGDSGGNTAKLGLERRAQAIGSTCGTDLNGSSTLMLHRPVDGSWQNRPAAGVDCCTSYSALVQGVRVGASARRPAAQGKIATTAHSQRRWRSSQAGQHLAVKPPRGGLVFPSPVNLDTDTEWKKDNGGNKSAQLREETANTSFNTLSVALKMTISMAQMQEQR
ncbi:hypothetical protein B0T21DRAFT_389702 [Apiosordaria backusii]|uniref:Uncharacterized protein n=1 Tax=Apiosordaria backusii TaxID=314023 RepID=A0AA40ERT4_9PEZI|nr:hypothetical protein B0T21DRAFT_389702 [Apiosordaria backusii]